MIRYPHIYHTVQARNPQDTQQQKITNGSFKTDVSVPLQDSALRYEPPLHELPNADDPTTQALCAVLWIGRAQVNLPQSPAEVVS